MMVTAFRQKEAFLQQQIEETAQLTGWLCAHFRPAMTQKGNWITAVSGDGAGFPDLVLAKGKRVIFAELKSDDGELSAEQYFWLLALIEADQEVYLWQPDDFERIVEILQGE